MSNVDIQAAIYGSKSIVIGVDVSWLAQGRRAPCLYWKPATEIITVIGMSRAGRWSLLVYCVQCRIVNRSLEKQDFQCSIGMYQYLGIFYPCIRNKIDCLKSRCNNL